MIELELYHHGVKGMKWGIRRYQNEDGTLTNAGKKRLSKLVDLDRQHKQAVSDLQKASNDILNAYRKTHKGKRPSREDLRNFYVSNADKTQLKKLFDKETEAYRRGQEIFNKYQKELSLRANLSSTFATRLGREKVEEILKNYKDG